MKDVAPRIFRGLEARDGRPGFDLIVTAAVSAYGSLRVPSRAQCAEFGRLVAPLWHQIGPDTRRALAASLSHTVRVPEDLVDLIVDAPLEIAAPFLVSSPALGSSHLERLARRRDERIDRLLKGRSERGLDTAAAPEAGLRPLVDAPPLAADHLGELASNPGEAAEFVRDTLRRIARAERPENDSIGLHLLQAARAADPAAFFETLGTRLSLSSTDRHAIEADASGNALAALLKSLGIGTGEALAIMMLVRPAIGLDVKAFEAMAARYRSLNAEPRTDRPSRREEAPIGRASPVSTSAPAAANPLRRRANG